MLRGPLSGQFMIFMIPHVIEGDAQNRAVVNEQSKGIVKQFPDLKKQQPTLDTDKERPLPTSRPLEVRPQQPRPQRP